MSSIETNPTAADIADALDVVIDLFKQKIWTNTNFSLALLNMKIAKVHLSNDPSYWTTIPSDPLEAAVMFENDDKLWLWLDWKFFAKWEERNTDKDE